jgi:2-amino-4-hydroxy-6-hydroxymethyldihydropteridine diphosphokinase
MARHRYLVALGSNMRHHRHGRPEQVLREALRQLDADGLRVKAESPIMATPPLGPSRRRFANAAAIITAQRGPEDLLAHLQGIESRFGRKRGGQRWAARVLDLDVVLWSGGMFAGADLIVPHPRFRMRRFVLAPAVRIAAHWRDPVSGLSLAQLHARLTRRRPTPN